MWWLLLALEPGHYQGNVTLYVVREFLHESYKTRPGCYLYSTVNLEVKEVGALECMVLIAWGSTSAEAAYPVRPGSMCVSAKLNVKAVVGASEPECLWAEVVRAIVEIGGWVEGRVELVEGR